MGRRHFLFGPAPRAMQESILEGWQVRNATDSLIDCEPIQSRRRCQGEGTTGGATTSSFQIMSKRHFEAVEHKECGREVSDSCEASRGSPGPKSDVQ
eukprot:Skav226694  [mRNA]  locus=scaffold3971:183644:188612:- [translate_table: standard]